MIVDIHKPDISTLVTTGHFYFGWTGPITPMSSQNENVRFHQNRNVLSFGGGDLKSCSNPVSRSPSSSEQHALRCGRVKLSTKRSSFDSLKA
jgi:hypothetical protein